MKAKVSLKMFVLSAALLVVSLATSARSYDNQLIYNPIEENGMTCLLYTSDAADEL